MSPNPDVMRRLNFRQRVSWLLVVLYLALTAAIMYYTFEISERYNSFAIDHVEHHHRSGDGVHLADIPLAVWLLLMLLPYLQVFFMLLACTKPEPLATAAFLWPGLIWTTLCRRPPSPQHATLIHM